jgi:hypothetical protein
VTETGTDAATTMLRPDVRAALGDLGVQPASTASLPRVREFVNDLYTWELRRLRRQLARADFPKREYAGRVEALRRQRYWLLSVPIEQWCAPGSVANHI